MTEFEMVRGLLLRLGQGLGSSSQLARALVEWAGPHIAWLTDGADMAADAVDLACLIAAAQAAPVRDDSRPSVLLVADELAEVLELAPFDRTLLAVMIASDRLWRMSSLVGLAVRHGHDLPQLLGELAGAPAVDAARAVRASAVLRLGLLDIGVCRIGQPQVDVRWSLERVLDRSSATGGDLVDLLVGPRRTARLTPEDFAGTPDLDFLVALLAGAARDRAPGVNILIHGPPGTGKTELACTLAAAANLPLHAVGEADADGHEPTRWERVQALQIAQRMLGTRGRAVLLFDEMEDFIGDATPGPGDWFSKREGSKVFMNRMIETNAVPIIWTTNAVGNVDDAILRRMSFVLRMETPGPASARRMLARIAAEEGVAPEAAFEPLLDVPGTTSVLRTAMRAARLGAAGDGGARAAQTLVEALRGGPLPAAVSHAVDLDLFESDKPVRPLFEAIAQGEALDVSLLLSGPPGTGKTALAHHLAHALDRPLIVKRTSDLLSKWVGETEAAIARSFEDARRRGGVLLFDEADSLLFDRSTARASWEVSQVNELLTWLDRHPLPVIAATNFPGHLDPATLRRFVFKLALRPLEGEKLRRAFERSFGRPAPRALMEITGLTPGDFSVVARQLRFEPAPDAIEIVERLRAEAAAKPASGGRIGFS